MKDEISSGMKTITYDEKAEISAEEFYHHAVDHGWKMVDASFEILDDGSLKRESFFYVRWHGAASLSFRQRK